MDDDVAKYLFRPTKMGHTNPIGRYIVGNSLRENDILRRLREVSSADRFCYEQQLNVA